MFDHCLYFNTTALARRLEREWVTAFKPFDLSPPQAFLLRAVLATPGVPQRELDQLAEKGFIERKTSGEDGREVFIFPTEKACKIKLTLNDASGRVTQRLKRYLGEEMFVDTVNKVRSVRTALR
jgi:hypothetical protein